MSPISAWKKIAVLLTAASVSLFFGCSKQNTESVFDPQTGKHPANWVQNHPSSFLSNPSKCSECHGSDLKGGISKVSCFSASFNGMACHPNGPGHANPAVWATPAQHGAAAKAAPNSALMHGFSTCQLCHGGNFTGGIANQTCLNTAGCHGVGVMSPHPSAWLPTDTYNHNTTDPGNASVCALCHTAGANSPLGPLPPLPGTPPGCFNSTLCHSGVHPSGWSSPSQHGAHAKLASDPSTTSGFSTCQTCHGNDFSGGSAYTACSSCHGGSAPHPTSWLPDSTYHHNTTDPSNAPVCGLCHLSGRTPPSYVPLSPGTTPQCFDNSLCHGPQ